MRRYVLAGLALIVVVGFVLCRPGKERFEIAQGYVGPVVVFFSHPQGGSGRTDWGTHVYEIPKNGLLLLKSPAPAGFQAMEWFYMAPDGTRTRIPMADDARPDPSVHDPRVVSFAVFTKDDGRFTWIQANIGRPSDANSFGTPAHFVADGVLDGLRSP